MSDFEGKLCGMCDNGAEHWDGHNERYLCSKHRHGWHAETEDPPGAEWGSEYSDVDVQYMREKSERYEAERAHFYNRGDV